MERNDVQAAQLTLPVADDPELGEPLERRLERADAVRRWVAARFGDRVSGRPTLAGNCEECGAEARRRVEIGTFALCRRCASRRAKVAA